MFIAFMTVLTFYMLQSNTDVATFTLVNSMHHDLSPLPYCNVHVCVRQDEFIGCKKSLDCALIIPSIDVPRFSRSYEEPSEELLQNCEQENLESDSVIPSCSDKMWGVFYTTGYDEGEVSLQINLQGNDKVSYFQSCITLGVQFTIYRLTRS